MERLRIGLVAERAGIAVDTVRYYEREGLIPEPPRTPSGYRQYSEETVGRLLFIQRAKTLGFTLNETRELLELRLDDGARPADVKRQALAKLREIDGKLRDLRGMRNQLVELLEACSGAGAIDHCAILGALSADVNPEKAPAGSRNESGPN